MLGRAFPLAPLIVPCWMSPSARLPHMQPQCSQWRSRRRYRLTLARRLPAPRGLRCPLSLQLTHGRARRLCESALMGVTLHLTLFWFDAFVNANIMSFIPPFTPSYITGSTPGNQRTRTGGTLSFTHGALASGQVCSSPCRRRCYCKRYYRTRGRTLPDGDKCVSNSAAHALKLNYFLSRQFFFIMPKTTTNHTLLYKQRRPNKPRPVAIVPLGHVATHLPSAASR